MVREAGLEVQGSVLLRVFRYFLMVKIDIKRAF